MDEQRFQVAERLYANGDYKTAAREYLAAAQGTDPEGTGRAYHMAGNALMKLHRYADAATVYGHAAKDPGYEKSGSVHANLGTALAADGRAGEAVEAFDVALEDPGYETAWKALQGKAGALYKSGRLEEAAATYREAAWADGNPDPGRSLNNLGLCFMALSRPEEAVEAYKAALGVEGYEGKGKASANLGLAYNVMGFADEAARAFETARDMYGHELSGAALAAYGSITAAPAGAGAASETMEGWETGEMPAVVGDDTRWGEQDADSAETAATFDEDSRFFTMTEDEMRVADREARNAARRARLDTRAPWVRVAGTAVGVLVAASVLAGLWYAGIGYPTQSATVAGMIDTYRAGRAVESYWVAVPSADVKEEMRHLPAQFASYRIAGVRMGPSSSVVRVSVAIGSRSDALSYDVLLVREGVGWKVNGIRNAWSSTKDGS